VKRFATRAVAVVVLWHILAFGFFLVATFCNYLGQP
jgi:hypothetical protein